LGRSATERNVHTHTRARAHTHARTHIYIYTVYRCVYIYIYTHTHTYIYIIERYIRIATYVHINAPGVASAAPTVFMVWLRA